MITIKPDPIACTVISPMFSYGNGRLEPRATEIKGLLRYVYRIANPSLDVRTLYQYEATLFGGQTLEKSGEIITKTSPLRIQMLEQLPMQNIKKEYILLHKNNVRMDCYSSGKKFDIKLSVNPGCVDFSSIPCLKKKDLLQWYQDLFYLSLVIGGIGKRSRRGRGCMTANALLQISRSELPQWIANHLNEVCGARAYTENENGVFLLNSFDKTENRPVIKEIRFGRYDNDYLKKVDKASHQIKGIKQQYYATGFVYPNRFASSVIVSLAEVKDGIVPVYTLLNAVCKNKYGDTIKFNKPFDEQNDFIEKIEAGDNS